MSESLRDLLCQSADTVERPRLDARDLIARTERRLVRRRLAAVAATAAVVVLIAAGGFALRPEGERPAPAPPSPDQTEHTLGMPRPFTYAEGTTIHYGDRTYDAGRVVEFVEATDNGFVYVDNDSRRLWFTDGSYAADRIGMGVAPGHVGDFPVLTSNPDRWWPGRR